MSFLLEVEAQLDLVASCGSEWLASRCLLLGRRGLVLGCCCRRLLRACLHGLVLLDHLRDDVLLLGGEPALSSRWIDSSELLEGVLVRCEDLVHVLYGRVPSLGR